MKTLNITGKKRENFGKKGSADLRRGELIPCVLYGGQEPIHFAAPEKEFKPLVYTSDIHTVNIDVDGAKYKAIMQDIQFHKVTDRILHVDFMELVEGKKIKMELPIRTEGAAPGVRAGGKLVKKLRFVTARGLADKFPEAINLNIEKMEIGDSVRVKDLSHEGLEFLNSPNATLVSIRTTRNVEEAAPAAGKDAGKAAPKAATKGAAAPAKK